jgi:quercetin dioxygenase-like cupin family protein
MSQLSGKPTEQVEETHRDAGNLIVFDLRTLTHFREEEPYVQVLSDIGVARLVLFAFKAGQQLREHCTSSQILVQTLRGRLTFTAVGRSIKLHVGMVDRKSVV